MFHHYFINLLGGNIHKHSYDEKCYGNNIYLFNLKSFSWVSSALLTALEIPRNSSWQPPRGRFSLVATVINGRTLVVSGGFSGFVNGDLLVYKFPSNIGTGNLSVTTISGKHCSRYNKNGCGLDPSCVWCVANVNCLPIHQVSSCSAKTIPVTPHICSAFPQCGSCLSWGSQVDLACGWCVQDSRCYPHSSPAGACSPRTAQNVDRMRGWWGENSLFLTTLDKCRTKDNLPGLMVNEYYRTWTENQPDRVSIVNPLRATFNPRLSPFIFPSSYDVKVRMTGFIYPFLSTPINNNVEIALKCNKSSVSLRLSTDEDPDKMVGSYFILYC